VLTWPENQHSSDMPVLCRLTSTAKTNADCSCLLCLQLFYVEDSRGQLVAGSKE
jgi:hypothetical protein